MLLKEIKITDKDSKKLFIDKCISLVAKLDFSNIYKRRLYENIPLFFFLMLPGWLVQLCRNECYLKAFKWCKGISPEGSSIFKWYKALCHSESYLWGYMKLYVRTYTGEITFLSLCLYPRLYPETLGHGLGISPSSSYGMTDSKLLKSLKRFSFRIVFKWARTSNLELKLIAQSLEIWNSLQKAFQNCLIFRIGI